MNGKHVRSKLKIRNRILAIAVAFLLLFLMVPKMSFAEEPTVQSNDNAAEEVNTEAADPVADVPSNDVTISGTVSDVNSSPIGSAQVVFVSSDLTPLGNANSGADGSYSANLVGVSTGDQVLFLTSHSNYAQEMGSYIVTGGGTLNLTLKTPTNLTVKPRSEHVSRHVKYIVDSYIDGVKCMSAERTEQSIESNSPANATVTMTDRAHLDIVYTNSLDQVVKMHIEAKGTDWYKAFWWGIESTGGLYDEMPVGVPYVLDPTYTYTVAVHYQELSKLDFSSTSEQHDYFDINYVKNGAPYVNLQQASFQNTTFAGATCTVCDDGKIKIYFDDSDDVNLYNVVGYIAPVAKAGYKLANWTCNGETLKAGDSFPAEFETTMAFEANYEVDASQAPKTGDMPYIYILALIALAAVSSVGVVAFRKNR